MKAETIGTVIGIAVWFGIGVFAAYAEAKSRQDYLDALEHGDFDRAERAARAYSGLIEGWEQLMKSFGERSSEA